jgi:phage shock protein A
LYDAEQRLWRTVTRRKYQLRRDHVRLQNQVESLLEEAHIKLSSLVSDLLGASARRMLKALAEGETNPAALAALADWKLRATPEQLCDALGACTDLKPVYRRLLKMVLEQLQFLEQQIGQLDQEMASLLSQRVGFRRNLPEISQRNPLLRPIKNSERHWRMFEGAAGAIHPTVAPVGGDVIVINQRLSASSVRILT